MLQKQITSVSVDWYNCGLCCALDEVHEKTTIYLRKSLIKIEKYNGLDELLHKREYSVSQGDMEHFFDFINRIDLINGWEGDYEEEVCDGSQWEIRLRYNDKTVKKVQGNAQKPDKGKTFQKLINDMLFDTECIESPILFGC